MTTLKHVCDNEPGFFRKGRGRGFEYFDCSGKKVTDPAVLQRFRQLHIPPKWASVWICKDPSGHLQATGKDARGRKQYLYHETWMQLQNENKFARLAEFARVLPRIRDRVKHDLQKKGWPKEKVMALLVNILDESHIRIGNQQYMEENGSFGLTTLRRKHMQVNGSGITFRFRAKSGKDQKITIKGKKLNRLIRECSQLPGHEVFQYLDDRGGRHTVYSQDVNEYLRELSGEHFTAKDFRTWSGTVLAVELLEETLAEVAEQPKRKPDTTLVRKVAANLGNTLAVCRDYYIHPAVMGLVDELSESWELPESSSTPAGLREKAKKKYPELATHLSEHELLALERVEGH